MPPRRAFPHRDPIGLERLRARVRALEATGLGAAGAPRGSALARFGAAAVDRRLPWGGLPRGALHEVVAGTPGDAGAVTGFAAALAGRFGTGGHASVLWCEGRRTLDAGGLYPPGLAQFGTDPTHLIVARPRNDAEALWAVEEGLRGRGLAAVVGEVETLSLTESRRLQLAAAASGTPVLILLPRAEETSVALTRWEVTALPGASAVLRWRATLARCRGGTPFTWDLEWRDETRGLVVAAPVRDRPGQPQTARLGAAKLAG